MPSRVLSVFINLHAGLFSSIQLMILNNLFLIFLLYLPVSSAEPANTLSGNNRQQTTTHNKTLIKSFQLLTPTNAGLCQTYAPWALGSRRLHNNASIPENGCISIKIEATKNSRLYLYTETLNGNVTQLMPNTCNAMNMGFNILLPNTIEYFPKDERMMQGIIPIKKLPGVYRFYAVITDNIQADHQLAQLANQLTSVCSPTNNNKKPASSFSNLLNLIQKQSAQHMQWQSISIQPYNLRKL